METLKRALQSEPSTKSSIARTKCRIVSIRFSISTKCGIASSKCCITTTQLRIRANMLFVPGHCHPSRVILTQRKRKELCHLLRSEMSDNYPIIDNLRLSIVNGTPPSFLEPSTQIRVCLETPKSAFADRS